MAVQTQIQARRGTAASWTSTNPTLAAGETGYETDTGKFKIGNGSTAWAALAYATNGAAVSPLTTKGDLYTYSTADTRLPVGANGETIVADSSTSTGLRYQGSQAAAKNIVINGDMNIWQRGTSFSVGAFSYTYTADRWQAFSGNACTISQETTTVPSGSQYALKITGGATTSGYEVWQPIETANAIGFANQTITGSLLANGTTGSTVTLTIDYSTSTDVAGSGSWTAISPSSGAVTMTSGTFTKVSTTVTVPSTAKSLRFRVSTSALTSGQFVTFGKCQLELGSVATAFTRAGGTIQGELGACQRYYIVADGRVGFSGNVTSGGLYVLWAQYPVSQRTASGTITLTNFANNNFTGAGTVGSSSFTGFQASNTATGTGVGYFINTYTVSSEL